MNLGQSRFERICVIVSSGQGSKVLKAARRLGAQGGTISLGTGTARGWLVDLLGLTDSRKEIVHMIADRHAARRIVAGLDEEFAFAKPNHGIAFTTPVAAVAGSRHVPTADETEERGEEKMMFQAINVIVEKGRAELVVDAATRTGAKGGTIVNARGAGVHETRKLFGMDVEPEMEMVLILAEIGKAEAIVDAIRADAELDKPGKGLLFVQDVCRTCGVVR